MIPSSGISMFGYKPKIPGGYIIFLSMCLSVRVCVYLSSVTILGPKSLKIKFFMLKSRIWPKIDRNGKTEFI